jgi:hypothetical protein
MREKDVLMAVVCPLLQSVHEEFSTLGEIVAERQ